jgi:hypothetical protein
MKLKIAGIALALTLAPLLAQANTFTSGRISWFVS